MTTNRKWPEEDLARIRAFRLIDDDFMKVCFAGSPECVEFVLRTVLDKPTLKVRRITVPSQRTGLRGHSVIFDVLAVDAEGKAYDIEIQRSDRGAGSRRARFYSAALDFGLLGKGESYEALPESYVLFITENDVLGKGFPVTHFERMAVEDGNAFGDGSHIVYVNGAWRGKDAVGRLMRDFFCSDPKKMKSSVLKERTRELKETEKGVGTMCKMLEEMRNEAEARGEARGEAKGRVKGLLAAARFHGFALAAYSQPPALPRAGPCLHFRERRPRA